ncbi:class I SAM-dependent methyltransferase [Gordonia sinesedis]
MVSTVGPGATTLGGVGLYGDRILPHLIDLTCGTSMLDPLRDRACADLAGQVVEIGFGSGRNIGHYPDAVTRVVAVEPNDTAWEMATSRTADAAIPIDRGGLDGERLPFGDNTFDAALSTFTVCTVADPVMALRELARVVRPGGMVAFLEHGRAPDRRVRRWQRRLEPIQRRVAGGCHLTRDIPALFDAAGLAPVRLDTFYQRGTPKAFGALSLGVSRVA